MIYYYLFIIILLRLSAKMRIIFHSRKKNAVDFRKDIERNIIDNLMLL